MFGRVIAKLPPNNGVLKTICPTVTAIRHGHRVRGKPFGIARNLVQRLECKYLFEVRFFISRYRNCFKNEN